MLAEGEALQFAALQRLKSAGAVVKLLPEPVLAALRGAWADVAAESVSENLMFKKVYSSYAQFRASHRPWRSIAHVE